MRYDDWDVILFPRESHVPIQEFKTACYVSSAEGGRQLPTLTSYISSLPPSTPFRISIHSWATAAKPSVLIESQRKPNQKVVYCLQVIVDGTRVFRGLFDVASKWPQEIAHEKRTLSSVDQLTSQKKPCLEFPAFHPQTLVESSWNARGFSSRIIIMLSEQVIGKTTSPGELDLGATNDIVCFSFQHAPKDVLEQAGISWPIRNPLYLPSAYKEMEMPSQLSPTRPRISRNPAADTHMQSPLSYRSKSATSRRLNADSHGRHRSYLPTIPRLSKLATTGRSNERSRMRDEFSTVLGDGSDNGSTGAFSTKRSALSSTTDAAIPDYMFTSSHPTKQHRQSWVNDSPVYEQDACVTRVGHRMRMESDRPYVVSLQDDQLGQYIQAISPVRKDRELPYNFGGQLGEPMARPPTAYTNYQPTMGHGPITTRPSSASMIRTSSYPDFNSALRNASTKSTRNKTNGSDMLKGKSFPAYPPSFSGNKENRPPSQARMPTPYAWANRVPTPNPFANRLPVFDTDVHLRELGSEFAAQPRLDLMNAFPPPEGPKIPSAHGPSTMGSVRSRKEGLVTDSPRFSDRSVRHDQNLLATSNATNAAQSSVSKQNAKQTRSTQNSIPALVEIIDVDAIDPQLDSVLTGNSTKPPPFRSSHKPGMSSMDSTGRLEQQLFSALGEELGSFEETIDANGMGPELTRALGGSAPTQSELSGNTAIHASAGEFEPTVKRKRQGTLGEDRDRSPLTKREKAGIGEALEEQGAPEECVLILRGD